MSSENKKSAYISGSESRRITRFNRRVTKKLEKARADAAKDESLYTTRMKDPNNVVEFDNVCTYFFSDVGVVRAVDGVSYEVPVGKTVGIVGESGCGKSVTSLSLMQLLQRPSGQTVGGEIRFNLGQGDGRAYNIVNTPNSIMEKIRGNRISMIFQEPMTALNPVFRIGQQVDEVTELHFELSGGMRQRVCIAIALACRPALIIADEPTTALDVTIQAQILDLLGSLKDKLNSSIMLITHDLGVVAGMADYVVVMYAGRVVEKGTTEDIFHHPAHPYTIGLMRSKPVVGKKVDALYNIPGSVPNPVEMPNYCYFRDRCEMRCEACAGKYPPEIRISDTHVVSCYRFMDEGEVLGYPKSVDVEAL